MKYLYRYVFSFEKQGIHLEGGTKTRRSRGSLDIRGTRQRKNKMRDG